MKIYRTFLLLWSLVGVASVQGGELSGVYVNKASHYYRIEFLPDGRYLANGVEHQGTYTIDKDTCICRSGADESTSLRAQRPDTD